MNLVYRFNEYTGQFEDRGEFGMCKANVSVIFSGTEGFPSRRDGRYIYNLSVSFHSYQLVYVDESGCDKRVGFRRTGWSPLRVTPVQIT